MKISANKKDTGIPMPTMRPLRKPIAATTSVITKASAVTMLPSSSATICRASGPWSWVKMISTWCGRLAWWRATTAFTLSMAWMMFAVERFTASMDMARRPLTRAWLVRSLKVRRTVATSPNVTTESPLAATGRSNRSGAFSMTLGTFTDMRPWPVSMLPAGISRLLRSTVLMIASLVSP